MNNDEPTIMRGGDPLPQSAIEAVTQLAIIGGVMSVAIGVFGSFAISTDAWLFTAAGLLITFVLCYARIAEERRHANQRANDYNNAVTSKMQIEAERIAAEREEFQARARLANMQAAGLLGSAQPESYTVNERKSSNWVLTVQLPDGQPDYELDGRMVEAAARGLRENTPDLREYIRQSCRFANDDYTVLVMLLEGWGLAKSGKLTNARRLAQAMEYWHRARVCAALPHSQIGVSEVARTRV